MKSVLNRFDVRVSAIYFLVAVLWILTSDALVFRLLGTNAAQLEAVNTFKGLAFVAATTTALLIVVGFEQRKRVRSEDELRDSEKKLRLFIEHAPAALAMFDRDMRYIAVSRRWITDFHLETENVLGRSHYEVFPDIPDRWKAAHQLGLQGQTQIAEADEFKRADGSAQWYRWEVHPWYVSEGKIGGIVIFDEDITQQIQTQAYIRYQANLIESVSDAIISTDSQFVIKSWNKAAEVLYGWQAQEVIGKPMSEVVPTQYPENNSQEVLEQFRSNGLWRGEVIQSHRDGTPIDILSSVSLNLDSHGTVIGAIAVNRDIRERKRDEKALQRYNQRLSFMHQIDQDIINARPSEVMSHTVIRHICQLVACDNAAIVLFERDEAFAVMFKHDGDGTSPLPVQIRIPMVRNATIEKLEAGQVVIIPDLRLQEGAALEFAQLAIPDGFHATLSAPIRIQERLIGHLNFVSSTPNAFTVEHGEIVREVANQLAVAFQNARLMDDIRSNNQRLQALSAQLVEAQEAERRHIARELHDEVGQTLTALGLMLDVQVRQSEAGNPRVDIRPAQTLVSDLTKVIRELSLDLRPSMLDDLGLIPTLVWYFKRYYEQTGITIEFKHSGVEHRFPPAIETTLYRITQEALTNVARHANVHAAAIQLWATDEAIHVQVADEGHGFDLPAVQKARATGGVLGLYERAQLVGGQCEINSSPGEGTIVSAKIPLEKPD
jgi:PAS domain S-box-containing protein